MITYALEASFLGTVALLATTRYSRWPSEKAVKYDMKVMLPPHIATAEIEVTETPYGLAGKVIDGNVTYNFQALCLKQA